MVIGDSLKMSELDQAMLQHMAYLVHSEYTVFCYRDFLNFEVDGIVYGIKHGTFRNKISKLNKQGHTELYCKSGIAFYTLKGMRFGKQMTHNHTVVVHSNPLYKMLEQLPFDKQSIHDIRLRFKVPNIWKLFSVNPMFFKRKRSNDILIPAWMRDNTILKVIIHKTDVVSVIVSCSLFPIPLDADGIIRFFILLALVEERLRIILQNTTDVYFDKKYNYIPEYKTWIVTMWHFGRDALTEFAGERLSITIEQAQHILTRLYVKDFHGKKRIRIERQEYPNMGLEEAIQEKIYGTTNSD